MKTKRLVCFGLMAAVCAGLCFTVDFSPTLPWLREALVCLWPLLTASAALAMTKLMVRVHRYALCALHLVYFALAGFGIFALTRHPVSWHSHEITEVVYLILCTDIALFSVSLSSVFGFEFSRLLQYIRADVNIKLIMEKAELGLFRPAITASRLICTLAANAVAICLLLGHDRVWDILFGRTGLQAWCEYRSAVFTPELNWAGVALMAGASALAFVLVRCLPGEHHIRNLYRAQACCILLRTVMGLCCGLFSVTSSRISLPGSSVWDIISLVILAGLALASIAFKEVEEREYVKWFRLGPLQALDKSVPQAAAPAPGSNEAGAARPHGLAAIQDTRQDPREA